MTARHAINAVKKKKKETTYRDWNNCCLFQYGWSFQRSEEDGRKELRREQKKGP